MAVRRRELLEAVSPPLLQYLCENTRSMVMDKACSVAVSDILGAAVGDLRPAMEAVAQLAAEDFVAGGVEGEVCYGLVIYIYGIFRFLFRIFSWRMMYGFYEGIWGTLYM